MSDILERLQAMGGRLKRSASGPCGQSMETLEARREMRETAELLLEGRDEVERLRKDKARLDWLIESCSIEPYDGSPFCYTREQIDAVMAEEGGE